MLSAMQEVDAKGKVKAKENAEQFYSQGSPKRYDRTGKYGDAPDSTGAQGGGGHVSTEIYMNESGFSFIFTGALLQLSVASSVLYSPLIQKASALS